jgi:hypothetical protein
MNRLRSNTLLLRSHFPQSVKEDALFFGSLPTLAPHAASNIRISLTYRDNLDGSSLSIALATFPLSDFEAPPLPGPPRAFLQIRPLRPVESH